MNLIEQVEVYRLATVCEKYKANKITLEDSIYYWKSVLHSGINLDVT